MSSEPHASEEPTVVDTHRPPAPEDASASGASGTLGVVAQTEVSAAVPQILLAEEHSRALGLFRLAASAALVTMVAVWLPERVSPGRTLAFVSVCVTLAITSWLWVTFKTPRDFDHDKLLVLGLSCVVSVLSVIYFVGVFSAAVIALFVGVYFYGLSDSARSAWVIYVSAAAGYFALDVLCLAGVIPTHLAVFALDRPEKNAMLAVTLVTQVMFAATFWMARRSRAGTLAAFDRLERATRQIKKRDALLDEARAELDHERAAKLGRFTDQRIGKYQIGEVIGRGAMGEVYRAVDDAGGDVAVKFLNPAMSGDPATTERFLREAVVQKRLKSKHVVTMIESGLLEGRVPYLVMELLEGRDLAELLREKKRFGMSATIELITQVASALAAADESGIVHRDLKPQNLFLIERGGQQLWKVLDFGVSKLLEAGKDLTMGAAIGTPSYMSPEQARGEAVDHRADVFALGIVLYRVLTGRPAFTAPDSASTLYNVVHVQPARPREFVRLDPDVERVICLALAKEPERRFSSSLMLAAALREAARHRLDERLRKDADALLREQPWGKDVLGRSKG
jgi:serine/threonine-protein kinase